MSDPVVKQESFDNFFYYGVDEGRLFDEIENDVVEGLIQPKRSMFFNRQEGTGTVDRENAPNSLSFYIAARYEIIQWFAYRDRNLPPSDVDRRAAASQTSIEVEQKANSGEVDITVKYIPFSNFNRIKQVSLPLGRGA
jgi:hypothetical protein